MTVVVGIGGRREEGAEGADGADGAEGAEGAEGVEGGGRRRAEAEGGGRALFCRAALRLADRKSSVETRLGTRSE